MLHGSRIRDVSCFVLIKSSIICIDLPNKSHVLSHELIIVTPSPCFIMGTFPRSGHMRRTQVILCFHEVRKSGNGSREIVEFTTRHLNKDTVCTCELHIYILKGYALCRRPLDTGGEWDAQAAETGRPWRTDRACGPRPPLPHVAFWTDKKTSSLICLPAAAKAHKRRLRHTETAGPWRTDRACGPRPPVPNVAFWTDKKTSSLICLPAAKAHKRRLRHTETAGPWRTDRACGPRPPLPNVALWTDKKTSSLSCLSSSRKGSQTAPSPHRNSRALKDGPGLRATAPTA